MPKNSRKNIGYTCQRLINFRDSYRNRVIFWTVRRIFYTHKRYVNEEKPEWFPTKQQQKMERKEQIPPLIALVIASILQVAGLLV